jgi:hypothetical protein
VQFRSSQGPGSIPLGRAVPAALALTAVLNAAALAQSPAGGAPDVSAPAGLQSTEARQGTQAAEPQNPEGQKEPKKPEWVLAPIPMSSPSVGTGLEWAVGRVFPLSKVDPASPSSFVGVGGLFTNNGSRAVVGGGRMYLKEDRYRLTAAGGAAKINADMYGVGKEAGDRGEYLPLTVKGSGAIGEFLFRVRKNVYSGPRTQYRNLSLSLNEESDKFPDTVNPPEWFEDVLAELQEHLLQQQTVSIGPRLQIDTRDNTFYPRRGVFLDSGIDLFATALGSKWSYQYYKVGFNSYNSIDSKQLIAVRAMGCAAAGKHVPIYDLCLFGNGGDLRGYATGRYQDRRMFATQAEYRLTIPAKGLLGRIGLPAFVGFGGVAEEFSKMVFDELLPAGGAGLRFRLTKTHPINFRIDYGIGKVGHTWTISVGEAF